MGDHYLVSDLHPEKVLLVGVIPRDVEPWKVQDSLDELAQLTGTAGGEVTETVLLRQAKPNAATFIGSGKAAEIGEKVREEEIDTVVFDDDLSPAQSRNLEKIIQTKIIDRTQMILDIFAQHAHTREGSLQIELAQLEYLLPRLRHMWTHLERQKGGIGLRGPGEKQLEMDRRRIQQHIKRLKDELEQVRSRRAEQRRGRRRHGWYLLAFVGYTNAGKSTLLNKITESTVLAQDQLFSTLDPTTRRLKLPNNQMVLLTDTVGFIRKLPHHLVESFKATLEEVVEADMLVHVIDSSHPNVEQQIDAVHQVLGELGGMDTDRIYVLNKIDIPVGAQRVRRLKDQLGGISAAVSARTGEGIEDLLHIIADQLRSRTIDVDMRIPLSQGKLIATLQSSCNITEEEYEGNDMMIRVRIPHRLLGECRPYITRGMPQEESW